ncbi:MAG: helix-turn-helix transcriptional regulator [Angelakisella sp.]
MTNQFHPYPVDMDHYFRVAHLNEMLIGQTKEQLLGIYAQYGKTINLDFSHCYLCLTGLSKQIYTGVYGLNASQYMRIYLLIKNAIGQYLDEVHCRSEIVLFNYANKEIAVLFSPLPQCTVGSQEIAEHILTIGQDIYRQHFLPEDSPYGNCVALSPPLHCYEEISDACRQLQQFYRLRFFCTKPMVITQEKLSEQAEPITRDTVFGLLEQLEEAVSCGDGPETIRLCHKVFLEKIKVSYNFSLCQDTIFELRNQLYRYSATYDLDMEQRIDDVCRWSEYLRIEQLHENMLELLLFCADAISGKQQLSHITQESIRYMKKLYFEDISLATVAKHTHVVPNYLSRLFNRETGMSIPAYLTMIRLEKAKLLLRETNLRVNEVSQQVGIRNAHHFGLVFKKAEGMTPSEYRQNNG